jgi:hypothetical protein
MFRCRVTLLAHCDISEIRSRGNLGAVFATPLSCSHPQDFIQDFLTVEKRD